MSTGMKSKAASTPPCTAPGEPGPAGSAGQPDPLPSTPAAGVRGAWTAGRAPLTRMSAKDERIEALYNVVICALVLLGAGVGAMLLVDFLNLR
jgi:hypothetical protein